MESAVAEQLNLDEEYRALTTSAGILDCSEAAKIEVSGKNAVLFLNGLVTADLKLLGEGQGALAAFLNVQGKVLALTRIYPRQSGLLLELDASNREKIFRNLSRFVPAGEFELNDLTDQLALLSLQGPQAEDILRTFALTTPPNEAFSTVQLVIDGASVLVARHDRLGTPGFDLYIPRDHLTEVRKVLSSAAIRFGGRQVSKTAAEIVRIDAGVSVEPNEVNEDHILLETGLDNAVSYTKGCYLGQEIIARIHWRGQPARRIRRLALEAKSLPDPGTELFAADAKRVGELTSTTTVPSADGPRMVALGYVHRYYLTEGTRFSLKTNGVEVGLAEIASRDVSVVS
jgi:tRNA-modifying protein YgfZ